MNIIPKKGILLVKKNKNTQLKSDIIVEETDNDKALITGEVIVGDEPRYKEGDLVVFGKYSLFNLVLQGENYYFIDSEDILATYEDK